MRFAPIASTLFLLFMSSVAAAKTRDHAKVFAGVPDQRSMSFIGDSHKISSAPADCNLDLSKAPAATITVQIDDIIGNLAKNHYVNRDIVAKLKDGTVQAVPEPVYPMGDLPTNIDMKLGPKWANVGTYSKIIFHLKKGSHGTRFAYPKNKITDSSLAIRTSKSTRESMFCGRKPIDNKDGQTIELLVRPIISRGKFTPSEEFLNIGIVVFFEGFAGELYGIPIIIDPKVGNDG